MRESRLNAEQARRPFAFPLTLARHALFGLLVFGLAACGGSGGGGSGGGGEDATVTAPAIPVLVVEPQSIKALGFRWADVSRETEYRLLENPDGMSGFTQVASIAADATSHELEMFLPERINARYFLQACNSAGCSDSSTVFVSGTLAEAVGYVKASNTEAGDRFGGSIALAGDGNTLAVGTRFEASNATGINGDQADNSASNSGAVYVFTRSGTSWSQQAYVKASNTGAGDLFGVSVALSADGNTLAVGARNEDSIATGIDGDQADNSSVDSGAVYVFTRSDTTWSQQAYIKASTNEVGWFDRFGSSVALAADGNTLAVGAPEESSNATGIDGDQADNTALVSGAVYVFSRSGATWSQQAYIKASNTGFDDRFGGSVALAADGKTLAVGTSYEDSNATGINGDQADDTASDSGAVYVFTRSDTTWSQQAYIKASNTGEHDRFGYSVTLAGDGNTLAVGAQLEDSSAKGIDGAQGDTGALDSGAVYVFTRSGTTWSQQAYVKASNTGGTFGVSVALAADGNTLAVGAEFEDSNATGVNGDETNNTALASGAAYTFTRHSGTTWAQQAYVKASNTAASDRFGVSVALAADGNTLAVGAEFEDSNATGIDGDQVGIGGVQADNTASDSGAVYLY